MKRAATRPRATRPTPPRASAGTTASAPRAPSPNATTAASPSRPRPLPPPASASAPPFGRLLLAGFHSVGIDYIALDHLRKAKKNALNTREYAELWRLLHDLVLVVLLDFDVDADAIRTASLSPTTDQDLVLWKELVRVNLYDWGFVCAAFYTTGSPDASVVLLALAWLLAFSQFFERQHEAILQLYLMQKQSSTSSLSVRLPPYPNDVSLSESDVHEAVDTVVTDHEAIFTRLISSQDVGQRQVHLQQLQSIVGRIYTHMRALQSATQSYSKMLARLDEEQRLSGAVDDEELLPAYVLQVFAQGKSRLELHVHVISERLQMLEDEKLLYKWINSLLLQYAPRPLSPTTSGVHQSADGEDSELQQRDASSLQTLAVTCADLDREMRLTRRKVAESTALSRQIRVLYAQEKQKWREKPKTRTQQVKMDEKMDKLRQDVATNELWDVSTLLLDSGGRGGGGGGRAASVAHQQEANSSPGRPQSAEAELPVREEELVQLQQQLERVMQEITTEYCRVELQ